MIEDYLSQISEYQHIISSYCPSPKTSPSSYLSFPQLSPCVFTIIFHHSFMLPFIQIVRLGFKIINRTLEMIEIQKKGNNRQCEVEWKEEARRGRWKREKTSGPSIFIAKTYEILDSDEHSGIVSWNEQGTNFTILDVERFEQEILPAYFRHRNFSSFVRQLNMYDFHKIRNELNRNIFEHREFRRHARHLLRNIRRKGCTSRKANDQQEDYCDEQDSPYEPEEDCCEKQDVSRPTLASIENRSQISIAKLCQYPQKNQLIEDFISSLPEIVESEQQVRQIIRSMKRDSKYKSLSSKEDVRKVVRTIRRNKMRREFQDGLDELSIEEEIMVHNVDDREQRHPTLTVLSSDNFLYFRAPLICSLILEDIAFNKH